MDNFKRKKGDVGEELAVQYLQRKGYKIIERNYLKKWGEIDVIAKDKKDTVVFVEIKTSYSPGYRIEENIHFKKRQRIKRAAKTYLAENKIEDLEWQIDVLVVEIGSDIKDVKIRHIAQAVCD